MPYLDNEERSEDPYSLFIFAINTEQTKQKYITRFKRFIEVIGIDHQIELTLQQNCKIFTEKALSDNKWLIKKVVYFLQYQKERVNHGEISGATLRNYVKAIKLFCEMNELPVPWKKLTRGLPKAKNYADDRVPTIEEIQKIISYPDWRMKAIVFTMASSGNKTRCMGLFKMGSYYSRKQRRSACCREDYSLCRRSGAIFFVCLGKGLSRIEEMDGF